MSCRTSPYYKKPHGMTPDMAELKEDFPLHWNIACKKMEAIKLKLAVWCTDREKGIELANKPFEPTIFNSIINENWWKLGPLISLTPLEFCIFESNLDVRCLKILIKSGLIDINRPSTKLEGMPPLHFSLQLDQNEDVALAIIQSGKAILNTHFKGYQPSHLAAKKGFFNVLNELHLRGINLNMRVTEGVDTGLSPLQIAVANNQIDCAIELLKRNMIQLETDTSTDDRTFSIIQYALANKNIELMSAILSNNPSIDSVLLDIGEGGEVNFEMTTLIDFAFANDDATMLPLLAEYGQELDETQLEYVINDPDTYVNISSYLNSRID